MPGVTRKISTLLGPAPFACGMVTSLGVGIVTCCAAARAGLTRVAPFPWVTSSPDDGEDVPLSAHAAGDLTQGFEGQARLLRLAEMGLRALADEAGGTDRLAGVPLYVSYTDPMREQEGLGLLANEAAKQRAIARRPDEEEAAERRSAPRATLEHAWDVVVGGRPDLRLISHAGHTGFAECLGRVVDDFTRDGREGVAIVGGVDTLLTTDALEWLESTGRLKTAAQPVGLMPGEASVFFLVHVPRSPQAPGRGSCRVIGLAYGDEPESLLEGGSGTAGNLAETLIAVQPALEERADPACWVISDHNGESYRALEWGFLVSRLAGETLMQKGIKEWFPALSFGDTGAASGAIALAVAWRAFERGYAPARTAILLSSSDGPQRAVAIVAA